ncbi:hypothetical protein TNIN_311391 [Trichonephila inaurata madagascariensis]|uniref:DUF5641 domain-containing protein n=1 Tax=Trichonephila inaurata madagascariensis TaxID=2747483 RepID=A0A8X6XD40_9ARAC|nr:hypothetical protein TNIN_311391 [Trichonephila inaurata madagascariensis]
MNRLHRWELVQRMTQTCWSRWTTDYLNRLQSRPKHPITTTGLGATSPSRISFGDDYIAENSDNFRETILARNVYAAWARKLTNARYIDPDLQNYHIKVGKSGEIVNNLLTKLNVPLFKIPATEKDLDMIVVRARNKVNDPPPSKEEEKTPAGVLPPLPSSPALRAERKEKKECRCRRHRPPP